MRKGTLAIALLAGLLVASTGANALTLTSPEPGGKIADEQVGNSFGCTSPSISPELT